MMPKHKFPKCANFYNLTHTFLKTQTLVFLCSFISDVALAIVQSDQWEDAMRLYDEYEEVTPMKLLIKSMPGLLLYLNFCWWSDK